MEHVGEAVRHYRKLAEMTQQELARRAGLAPTSIVRLESGEVRAPRITTLHKLARALNINPAELVWFVSEINPPTAARVEASGPFSAVFERAGDWWIGYVEELPGANAQGETLEDAREGLREAVSLVLEANRELTRREFEGHDVVREPIGVV
jgi:transcriptional regulator with XRE-family HTH domain